MGIVYDMIFLVVFVGIGIVLLLGIIGPSREQQIRQWEAGERLRARIWKEEQDKATEEKR
jgi:hypothetical protein